MGVHGGGQGGVREETLRKIQSVSASPLHKNFFLGGCLFRCVMDDNRNLFGFR